MFYGSRAAVQLELALSLVLLDICCSTTHRTWHPIGRGGSAQVRQVGPRSPECNAGTQTVWLARWCRIPQSTPHWRSLTIREACSVLMTAARPGTTPVNGPSFPERLCSGSRDHILSQHSWTYKVPRCFIYRTISKKYENLSSGVEFVNFHASTMLLTSTTGLYLSTDRLNLLMCVVLHDLLTRLAAVVTLGAKPRWTLIMVTNGNTLTLIRLCFQVMHQCIESHQVSKRRTAQYMSAQVTLRILGPQQARVSTILIPACIVPLT